MKGRFIMEGFYNYRTYARTSHWNITAKIRESETEDWRPVEIPNIAAGGFLFHSEKEYKKGDILFFHLDIDTTVIGPYGPVKDIHMNAKAIIKADRGKHREVHVYAANFKEISTDDQIRLDELVRLTISRYGEF